jgi:hypothetical protein
LTSLGWFFRDYRYTAVIVTSPAELYSPAPGSTLPGSSATFSWTTGEAVSLYFLSIGSNVGAHDIYWETQWQATSVTVSGLPTNGRTLYVRLSSLTPLGYLSRDYTYIAAVPASSADLYSPSPGSALTDSTATFY